MSPSDDGVDGHIFLTSSSVYKIRSPISKDFQAMTCLSLKAVKDVLSFDKPLTFAF
jgi:hypothetical protein